MPFSSSQLDVGDVNVNVGEEELEILSSLQSGSSVVPNKGGEAVDEPKNPTPDEILYLLSELLPISEILDLLPLTRILLTLSSISLSTSFTPPHKDAMTLRVSIDDVEVEAKAFDSRVGVTEGDITLLINSLHAELGNSSGRQRPVALKRMNLKLNAREDEEGLELDVEVLGTPEVEFGLVGMEVIDGVGNWCEDKIKARESVAPPPPTNSPVLPPSPAAPPTKLIKRLTFTLSLVRLNVNLPLQTSNLSLTISALRGITQLETNKNMPKIYVDCIGLGIELRGDEGGLR